VTAAFPATHIPLQMSNKYLFKHSKDFKKCLLVVNRKYEAVIFRHCLTFDLVEQA
jgi:hypothetical protein